MLGWSNGMYGGWGGPLGWIGPAVMTMFWVAVIVGIVFAVRYFVRQAHRTGGDSTALDILNTRYAKDEIGKEEFEEKRKAIR
jgi:putative membrane protein